MEGQRNVFHTLKTKWLIFFFFFNISSETTEIWGLITIKQEQWHFKAIKAFNPQYCRKDQPTIDILD